MRILVSAFAALLFISTPALAAPEITDAGAAAVKKMVDDGLAFYLKNADTGQQGLKLSGPATVAPKNGFYEVTLPGVEVVSPAATLAVGTIILNAVPGKNGEYLTSMALPATMTQRDTRTGKDLTAIHIGAQKFAGEWQPALQAFTKMDLEYKDIAFKGTSARDYAATIGKVKLLLNLQQQKDNTWSGTQRASIENGLLTIPVTDKNPRAVKLTLAGGTLNTIYDKMDLAASQAVKMKMKALYDNGATPSQEDIKKLLDSTLASGNSSFIDGVSNNLDVTDISLNIDADAKAVKPEKPVVFKLARLKSSADIKGARQDEGSFSLLANLSDLSVEGASPEAHDLIPTNGTIDIRAIHLPIRDVSNAIAEALAKAISALPDDTASDEEKKAAADRNKADIDAATDRMMTMIAKKGSVLTIKDTALKSSATKTTVNGEFKALPAPAGVDAKAVLAGNILFSLEGTDALLARFQKRANDADAPSDIKKFIQTLSVLQMIGKENPARKGAREFRFELTPEGRLLLNGADLSAITAVIGGMQAKP